METYLSLALRVPADHTASAVSRVIALSAPAALVTKDLLRAVGRNVSLARSVLPICLVSSRSVAIRAATRAV